MAGLLGWAPLMPFGDPAILTDWERGGTATGRCADPPEARANSLNGLKNANKGNKLIATFGGSTNR
jgi:hypothetical protein